MSSHGGLLSVRSKHFVKFGVVLSYTCIWAWLYISSGNLQRWSSYACFVATVVAKPPQKSGVIAVCSGLERIGNSLEMRKNGWLCKPLESWKLLHSQPSLGHDKWDIFLTNLFRKLYPRQAFMKWIKQVFWKVRLPL